MALMEWATPTDIDARRDVGGVRVTGQPAGGNADFRRHGIPAGGRLFRYALPIVTD